MRWLRKQPPELPDDERERLKKFRLDVEERLERIELRQRALDVEMEDFVSKVSAAAKRAYKREQDADRKEQRNEPLTREMRKAQLRARVVGNGGA